ncbi:hypothetical protein JMA_29380 [Jeotgalibacillus malaysiensis]|uniref:Glycosyl transferase family 1 domain-containing protein n=1 Tax=Jeotgalibacillus malaysiensis TaxID=1508404 RepID=A0A0B5APU6_9BACL|nr:glycosyltransferase [Jeotgalibacillus malaysiensis]AJD92255.1 hypothetical protein JMA_29380 [Jeotgalibacillus malaysiensis]
MKKVILLDSSYPINSRNVRILDSLKKNFNVGYITWKRDGKELLDETYKSKVYIKKSTYGNRIKKALYLMGYYRFLLKNIKELNPDVVIASHWEMLLIASIAKSKNNYKLIYENLDMPDSKSEIVKWVINNIELYALRNTDAVILASRFFKPFYKKDKYLIYENYPLKPQSHLDSNYSIRNNLKEIAFIGNIRHYEVLINLIKASQESQIVISLYGGGPSEKKLKYYCEKNNITNVKFNGSYNFADISCIYERVDYVWAAYPNESFNVKHAISNKFFEVMAYNKIGLFSKNTKLGEFVENNNLGLVIDPYDINSITKCINKLKDDKLISQIRFNILEHTKKEEIFWESNQIRLINFVEDV